MTKQRRKRILRFSRIVWLVFSWSRRFRPGRCFGLVLTVRRLCKEFPVDAFALDSDPPMEALPSPLRGLWVGLFESSSPQSMASENYISNYRSPAFWAFLVGTLAWAAAGADWRRRELTVKSCSLVHYCFFGSRGRMTRQRTCLCPPSELSPRKNQV